MKKILLLAALAISSIAASAQVYMGGSVGLNRNTTENQTQFTINPEVGYNISDQWAVGASISYQYRYDDGVKSNVFAFDPYARYTYFKAVENRVKLFVDGGVGLGLGKSKYEDHDSKTVAIYSIGFRPGVAFDITNRFSLVTHFGFLGFQGCNDAAETAGYDQKFGFDFSSLNLTFGFYYNF